MLGNKQRWCMVCGEKVGLCDHNGDTTDDIILGYNVWLLHNRKELTRRNEELQRRGKVC